MKLLDLLVEEGVEWPEGANFVAQDSDRGLYFFEDKPRFLGKWDGWRGSFVPAITTTFLKDLAEGYGYTSVSREKYLEAKYPLNRDFSEDMGIENVGILISKYKEQISLSEGLKKLSLEYRHDAKETLKKVNSLLEDSGLEFSVKEGNKTSLW